MSPDGRRYGAADPRPVPGLRRIDPAAGESVRLLSGPPETVAMKSGAVVLRPGESVGRHVTRSREEVVVVLSGRGEFRTSDGTVLALEPHTLAYCPPETEHDVVNTGTETLLYVYVVAAV